MPPPAQEVRLGARETKARGSGYTLRRRILLFCVRNKAGARVRLGAEFPQGRPSRLAISPLVQVFTPGLR